MTTNPLGPPPYTLVHNVVLDEMLPRLKPNAFKILMVAIRKTYGWTDEHGRRKSQDAIPYRQFAALTGIKSQATVAAALEECLDAGYLVRVQSGTWRGKPHYLYSLKISPVATATESVAVAPPTATETVAVDPPTATETVASKNDDVLHDDDDDRESICKFLSETGIDRGPQFERVLQSMQHHKLSERDARFWLARGRRMNAKNPVGFMISQLLAGAAAPPDPEPAPLPRREKTALSESEQIWQTAQVVLAEMMAPATWDTTIRQLEAAAGEVNGRLYLTGPRAAVEWCQARLGEQVAEVVAAVAGEPLSVVFSEASS